MAYWAVRIVTEATCPYIEKTVNVYADGALESEGKALEAEEGDGVLWTILETRLDDPPRLEGIDVKLRRMGAPTLPGLDD